ncbi:MAG: ubiquinol-cytochrome C chaperone [Alphaproteobacteria bacterium]|nr:ubiquinol-cytochrome C chaperone [Alphaproteobacteria bacterium]MDE2043490.1 ubiquinol-cytochrome C chaperone [Alphaproteobacteria bacterium]MDE2339695.1 ubiquinol-cytochrome C chaperone [Alphaproteobacteria bacterium]
MFARLTRKSRTDPRDALRPLYAAIVAEARKPHWYLEGAVPDTLDGRFDMVALIAALTLMALELSGAPGVRDTALLTEVFIEDMDGQLRQIGVGDLVVGKHIGNMVAALGGRLGAYRNALGDDALLGEALVRNLYRGAAPAPLALNYMVDAVRRLSTEIMRSDRERLLAGALRPRDDS